MNEQTVRKTYKYKRKPTPEQEQAMAFVVRRCRARYNAALQERREAWQKCGLAITVADQSAQLPEVKDVRVAYRDIHSQVLQEVLTRLERAFQAFVRRVRVRRVRVRRVRVRRVRVRRIRVRRIRAGQRPGYPRFQGSTRDNSFTYKQFGNGAILDHGSLVRSKSGRSAVRWSRPLAGAPKTVTIRREADGWYVCLSCADVPAQPLPPTGQETGVDLGIEAFAPLSNGARIVSPGWYRQAERALKTAQRRVSRRTKGSNRRRQAVSLLAQAQQNVRRQRQDVHHKSALALVRTHDVIYDVIYHEGLQVRNMVKNHHLAKSSSDAGWAAFLTILSYKAVCAGREVVAVNPAFTSQRCSGCGRCGRAYRSVGIAVPMRTVGRACIGTTTPPGTSSGSGSAVGEAWRWLRRRTEYPLGFSPCGVSN